MTKHPRHRPIAARLGLPFALLALTGHAQTSTPPRAAGGDVVTMEKSQAKDVPIE